VVLAAKHGREIGQYLVDLVGVRARLKRRVLGTLQLGGSHELHGPRDLLDVADRSDAPPDLALARHLGDELRLERFGRFAQAGDDFVA
jgi:hypothetical protein